MSEKSQPILSENRIPPDLCVGPLVHKLRESRTDLARIRIPSPIAPAAASTSRNVVSVTGAAGLTLLGDFVQPAVGDRSERVRRARQHLGFDNVR